MARPVIALLTDFGLQDHYVGVMKGVALGICPDATLVDISHTVPPQDVPAAAFELDAAYRYFPPRTGLDRPLDPACRPQSTGGNARHQRPRRVEGLTNRVVTRR